ncbi:MAG: hypothetical protein JNK04_05465, partial [Myxococcales bacterium]|nr:hypothetical protein [Myxococcales bacterium]
MIGIGFAERLAGGHHPIGSTEPDKTFALDLVAEPARHGWRALGTLRAESIVSGAAVQGVIS